jgi:translocation and assembly module TamB
MRRSIISFSWIAALVLIAVLSLPWWAGVVLARVGPTFGLTFGTYERQGYRQFVLRDVEYRRYGVHVVVDQVSSDTPLVWLWRRVRGSPGAVVAGKWLTEVLPTESARSSPSPHGWLVLRRQLDRVFDILAFWLPRADIGPGEVKWPGGGLTFGPCEWEDRTLKVSSAKYAMLIAAGNLEVPKNGEMKATLKTLDGSTTATLSSQADQVSGTAAWWGQPIELKSTFAAEGWMPQAALVRSVHWNLPGEKAKLAGSYATLRGDADVQWKDGNLSARVSVQGEPLPSSKAPPLSVQINAHGEAGQFIADTFDVSLPGISAHLDEPVAIDKTGKLRSGGSHFKMACDLAGQPWFPARGQVVGEGTISAGGEGIAKIDYSARGENLQAVGFAISRAQARGYFEWPNVVVDEGRIATVGEREIAVHGKFNCRTLDFVDAVATGQITRPLVGPWLPDWLGFDVVALEVHADGPWRTVAHHGHLTAASVQLGKLKSFAAVAEWEGHGLSFERFTATASAGHTQVAVGGAISTTALDLTSLIFKNGEATRLTLTDPVRIRWGPQGTEVDRAKLTGPQSSVEGNLVWKPVGSFDASIHNLQSEWFRDLIELPATVWAVDSLDARASWANGPASYSLEGLGTVHLGPDRAAQISVGLAGEPQGMKITRLRFAEGSGVIMNASGEVPVLVAPRAKQFLTLADDAPFTFQAATSPNPGFWDKLSELAGIEIVKPEVSINFTGTWSKPRGEAQLRAERVMPLPNRFKWAWPKVESLDVRLTGDKDGLKVSSLSVVVEGQQIRAQASLPVAAERWKELVQNPREFLGHGELHLEVPGADLAAVAHFIPGYLAPKGELQLNLNFKSDETITGYIQVRDATSRPLGPLGVLQEVNAKLVFEGRAVRLEGVTARMGGQAVTLLGRAELPKGGPPKFDLKLTGENLPFVRQTGLLVRGDLDLKFSGAGSNATISGDVRLRDSLFLTDIRALIPTGAKGSVHRPPYFSIETPPLNIWRLNVAVAGQRFMRLRTPVFNGTASARFRLSGTLADPRIEGEAVVDEGTVRLPFANFVVQQGQVRLTPDQLEPQIWVTGTTRRYGYDLRMELTGSTSTQNLTFTSSPPLESEQVLLMVMAGQAPQNEINTTDRQRAARFGAFFGQSLLGAIGGDASGADRLTISSGENISTQGRETYSIEYRLDDRWALTGEYDEYDEYYGGVKWRFYERGGQKSNAH